jgi:hypothetical protein
MDIDSPGEYDFKFDPMQDQKPVRFPYNHPAWTENRESSNQANNTGMLSALPLDVFWTMLDKSLFEHGDLTLQHDAFHSLFSLSQVDPRSNQYVEEYISRRQPQHFLRRELGDIETLPYNEGDNNQSWYPGQRHHFPPNATDDFLGRVIQADCPSCFAYLLNYFELDIGNCNKSGWSFASLALINQSVKILKYMLNHPGSFHSLAILLLGPANINFPRPTPLGFLGQCGDREYLDQILYLVGDRFANLRLPSVVDGAFTDDEIIWLCSYISPNQARRLQELGVPITNRHDPETKLTSWHGAVANGKDFLEYMKLTSPLNPYEIDEEGLSPLGLAVSQDRVHAVRWFKKHGLANVSQEYGKITELTIAMQQTSGESLCIVQELLPSEPGKYLPRVCAAELMHHIVLALHTKDIQMRGTLGDEDYEGWRQVSEMIAIEKCKNVWALSGTKDPARDGSYRESASELEFTKKHYKYARQIAQLIRFKDLAKWIYSRSERL